MHQITLKNIVHTLSKNGYLESTHVLCVMYSMLPFEHKFPMFIENFTMYRWSIMDR